ncbi:MAG: hypothetical protein CMP34_04695 [Rickettsiales bacterium]|nr:hypothetical protein [Rickettsiales bacterium]|tara:strand:- start:1111 stop:1380 length:270 start_codon:yes stop_codon:yes gene_type:complete
MHNYLSELIELLKKISEEKQVERIAIFEKKINDLSLQILENKDSLQNIVNISSQLKELDDVINLMSDNQKKNLKIFDDFKTFIENRKIK